MTGQYTPFDLYIIQHQNEFKKEHWDDLSEKYVLSEDMIRLFQNKLNWYNIARYQELSSSFIKEFIDYQLKDLMDIICKYQLLSDEFFDEFRSKIDWNIVIKRGDYSLTHFVKYIDDIAKFRAENPDFDEVDN